MNDSTLEQCPGCLTAVVDLPTAPTFWVREVPVYGDAILAPMARYSDVPYRALCRAYGSAMSYSEFVPADALLHQPNPMWRRLDIRPGGEQPMVFQIFGYDAHQLLAAAQRIETWGPDIIDVNMGCSVPQVSEQGAGVGMMRRPELVAQTFRLLSSHLRVPVTGKIRLGWDTTSKNFLQIAHIMEDNGAALIAVHGRTKTQNYSHQADWDAIAEVKRQAGVPVIGNGDVQSPADIDRLKAHTGCDGVMIGRAAVGNPWIFARQERAELMFGAVTAVIRRHLDEMLAYYGSPAGLRGFRRHLKRYLSGLAVKRFLQPMLEAEETAVFMDHLRVLETAVPADEPLAALAQRTYFPKPTLSNQ
ncbi:MAG: tRNA-dihydrouridine synthase family protein [Chloroflexi bacterium]|nr:tRNA-dihydrouridine synthase family protein [Chloroflexota bacterium]